MTVQSEYFGENGNAGRRRVRGLIQAAEGTLEPEINLVDEDFLQFDLTPPMTFRDRSIVSSSRSGYGSQRTSVGANLVWRREIIPKTISTGATSEMPNIDASLRSSGFARYIDALQNAVFYTLGADQGDVATWLDEMAVNDNTKSVLVNAYDMRGGATLEIIAGDGVYLGGTHVGRIANVDEPVQTAASGVTPGLVVTNKPLRADCLTVKLINLTTNNIYEGGTLADPGQLGGLVSATVNTNNAPNQVITADACGAVAGAQNSNNTPTTEIVLIMNSQDSVNLWASASQEDMFEFSVQGTQPGLPNNNWQYICFGQISTDPAKDIGNGLYRVTITLRHVYPANSTGGFPFDPAAGTNDAQTFTQGTNQGLALTPTVALPEGDTAALMFWTA